MPSVLTDSILDELLVCGRHDELPEMLRARFDDIADGIVLPPLGDERDDESLGACVAELQRAN